MSEIIKAPAVSSWIERLKNRDVVFDGETETQIDRVFDLMRLIRPYDHQGENRKIWLKADRGTIEDYGEFEEYREDEVVETYEEFEEMWKSSFPEEVSWYQLITIERDDFRAVILGREVIFQERIPREHSVWEQNAKELFEWMEHAVNSSIERLREGTYAADVREHLPYGRRTGTVSRKDYWDVFPKDKEDYYSEITQEEIDMFVSCVSDQTDDQPVGCYIDEMTAGKFYYFCSLGYAENGYERNAGKTPKEQYYSMADGRDEGLSEIDEDSSEAFEKWFEDSNRFGGHPWEVCRGGNSTHISLYVSHDEHGYYLVLAGKSWGRSIETVKFYNALRKEGVAVELLDARGITDRLLGTDVIGIVPQDVIPVYCESRFPGMEILDYINLPYEKEYAEKMIPKVTWFEEDVPQLME